MHLSHVCMHMIIMMYIEILTGQLLDKSASSHKYMHICKLKYAFYRVLAHQQLLVTIPAQEFDHLQGLDTACYVETCPAILHVCTDVTCTTHSLTKNEVDECTLSGHNHNAVLTSPLWHSHKNIQKAAGPTLVEINAVSSLPPHSQRCLTSSMFPFWQAWYKQETLFCNTNIQQSKAKKIFVFQTQAIMCTCKLQKLQCKVSNRLTMSVSSRSSLPPCS